MVSVILERQIFANVSDYLNIVNHPFSDGLKDDESLPAIRSGESFGLALCTGLRIVLDHW